MGLLHMSGFEGAPKHTETPTAGTIYETGGRTGRCMTFPTGSQATCVVSFPVGGLTEFITGMAIRAGTEGYGYSLQSATRAEYSFSFSAGGVITCYRFNEYGGNDIFATIPAGWTAGQWMYFETHIKHSATGFIKIWINGTLVVDFVGDTNFGGAVAPVTQITLGGGGWYGQPGSYDDFYLLDMTDATATQGRPFNTVLGMPRIEPMTVIGPGPTNEWLGSDGNSVDNHLLVDEVPPSATDYVESSTPGQRELYDFSAPTLVGDVLAVDISVFTASPDGGINPIRTLSRSAGGAVSVGADVVPGVTFKNRTSGPKGKDADGNLWTPASVAASTFGVEVG